MNKKPRQDKMMRRTQADRAADWKKPRTGHFIKDCIEGNKAAIEALRRLHEEWEKQAAEKAVLITPPLFFQ